MKIIDRTLERFSELHPQRQKAIEYFGLGSMGVALAGVSVIPLVEGFGQGVGAVGIVEGTVAAVIFNRWGWQALDQARKAEQEPPLRI